MRIKSGELKPGQVGWVELDTEGNPVGEAVAQYPAGKPACRVLITSDPNEPVRSVSGAPLGIPINPGPEPYGADWYSRNRVLSPNDQTPILDSLHPATAVVGSEDVLMHCIGKYFTDYTVIMFNGGDEPTTFVSDTEVTTVVKPSLVASPISVPVKVRNGSAMSNELPFAFTEATKAAKK